MPKGIAKSGKRKCSPRAERVRIDCIGCGATRLFLPNEAQRRTGKFCSRRCAGEGRRLRAVISCAGCSKSFVRRRDKAGGARFCSRECFAAYRATRVTVWGKNVNLDKRRAYFRGYTEKNKERLFAMSADWARRNRPTRNRLQQLRRAGGDISKDEWLSILRKYGGRCALCGTEKRIEMDHIVPVALGGKTESSNLQPLCRICNASKGKKLMKAILGIEILET